MGELLRRRLEDGPPHTYGLERGVDTGGDRSESGSETSQRKRTGSGKGKWKGIKKVRETV
jgi:hypothetical protein